MWLYNTVTQNQEFMKQSKQQSNYCKINYIPHCQEGTVHVRDNF